MLNIFGDGLAIQKRMAFRAMLLLEAVEDPLPLNLVMNVVSALYPSFTDRRLAAIALMKLVGSDFLVTAVDKKSGLHQWLVKTFPGDPSWREKI